ncbi:MAG: hypothetical protein ABJL73_04675, partial [Lentilitoribacter sp.]
ARNAVFDTHFPLFNNIGAMTQFPESENGFACFYFFAVQACDFSSVAIDQGHSLTIFSYFFVKLAKTGEEVDYKSQKLFLW